MAIEIIHEAVLTRLLNNTEPLRFSLRTKNKRNDEPLSKGYWFTGNDSYLSFSFWEGGDWRNKTSNIIFIINADGKCSLEFVDNDNTEKARFFEEIAGIIGLDRSKNQERFQWRKYYTHTDYLKSLEDFLKKDKPIIDAFIQNKGKTNLLPPISEDSFKENLDNVLSWRTKLNEAKGCNLTMTDIKVTVDYIRLKTVILDNIGHFRHIELNLNQQVTCLIGENGSGKTSILRSIALGLAGIGDKSENTVIDPTDDAIQKMLRISKIEGDKEIFTANGQIKVVYNDNQEKNSINFEFKKGDFYDKNKKETKKNYVEIDDIGSDLTATKSNNHFINLVLGFSQVKTMPETNGHSSFESDENGRIVEVTPLIYSLPDRAFDNFSKWIIQLWNPSYDANSRIESLEVLTQIFHVIKQIVGGQFEIMPMKEDQKEIFIKTNDAPDGIPMRLISQGYHNVIGWVGYFMQRLWEVTPNKKTDFKQTPAVCLIDEIDTYLHPKWEQKILSVLAENFPNTQFVVTTHSPVVVANLKTNYKIYTITKHKDLMLAFEHNNARFNPYGAESSRILDQLMQFKERPDAVQKMINAYQNAYLQNDFETAEKFETELKNIIDSNDPILLEGEASIEARKMLQEL